MVFLCASTMCKFLNVVMKMKYTRTTSRDNLSCCTFLYFKDWSICMLWIFNSADQKNLSREEPKKRPAKKSPEKQAGPSKSKVCSLNFDYCVCLCLCMHVCANAWVHVCVHVFVSVNVHTCGSSITFFFSTPHSTFLLFSVLRYSKSNKTLGMFSLLWTACPQKWDHFKTSNMFKLLSRRQPWQHLS